MPIWSLGLFNPRFTPLLIVRDNSHSCIYLTAKISRMKLLLYCSILQDRGHQIQGGGQSSLGHTPPAPAMGAIPSIRMLCIM